MKYSSHRTQCPKSHFTDIILTLPGNSVLLTITYQFNTQNYDTKSDENMSYFNDSTANCY